jgi:hypothetical protein
MDIKREEHYGVNVCVNVRMDGMRKQECLCFNCDKCADKCERADELFELCKKYNLATMVTRCPEFRI